MPEPLKQEEVVASTDPTVVKQYDRSTPLKDQINEFYKTVDGLYVGLLTTTRPKVGPVARSMAIAKREGPDFLFIANHNSQKFRDLEHSKTAQITFQNSTTQDWVSITGTATTTSNTDSRIKDLYNDTIRAWFGDLGDGKHDGGPDDPRMALIEIKAEYIVYWKATVDEKGFQKEVETAKNKGQVAQTGVTREFDAKTIEGMRKDA